MKYLVLFITIFLFQEIPFKAKEDFDIKLNYEFKQRPQSDRNSVHLNETRKEYERRTSTSLLPYLVLNLKLLKLSEQETRIRITNNMDKKVVNKKITEGDIIPIDLGFTDDVKDRVSPHQYVLTLLTTEKKEVSRIVIFIEEDGAFLVNGEKRGKF